MTMTNPQGTLNLSEAQLEDLLAVIDAADNALHNPSSTNVEKFEKALQCCDEITFSSITGVDSPQ